MLIRVLYEIALLLIALVELPRHLYMMQVHGKYVNSFKPRLGRGFPSINKENGILVWIHAVSVGEIKAISPLVKMIKNEFKDVKIIISSTTETGHAEACRSIPSADYHIYLPFDFGWIIRPIVMQVKPDLVILSESDFWYNFLSSAKESGARIALVNGKISEKSKNRFLLFPFFTHSLFSLFDIMCVQNQHYYKRFAELGVAAQKLVVTGNMKFDDSAAPLNADQLNTFKNQLGLKESDQVIVFGSSHDPEEKLILDIISNLNKANEKVKLILVPRHPERFNAVAELIQSYHIPYRRFTQPAVKNEEPQVILIDAMGLLKKCYQLADLAIVGGSFTSRVGGHNILEPCHYGVPVIYGPQMFSQPELVEIINEYGAGIQSNEEGLEQLIRQMLLNKEQRMVIGEAGKKMMGEMNGATKKTLQLIKPLL